MASWSKGKLATPNKKTVMKAFNEFGDFFKAPRGVYTRRSRKIKEGSKYISATHVMVPAYYEMELPLLQTALNRYIKDAMAIAKNFECKLQLAFKR